MTNYSDKEQKSLGKTVQIGFDQISNPTPKAAKALFRIISFLTGLWAIAQQFELGIPAEVVDKVNMYCVAAVPFTHFAIKFFGWDYKQE